MRVENARRLTGRGFFLPRAGAAVELWLEGEELEATRASMSGLLDTLLLRLGLQGTEVRYHLHRAGFTVAVASPIDRALALADMLEWAAWSLAGTTTTTLDEAVKAFFDAAALEADPQLVRWQTEAQHRGVPFLWDDDEVSFGLGHHALVMPARGLPEKLDLDRRRVPVALITGTNGKTTTTRMTSAILKAAGFRVGATSTDAITLDGVVIEDGDWTGPGAARKVLRHPEVTAAVLETARGGILRRGLGYDDADAAIVTNVGDDHLGEYGIDTVAEMAAVKAVVWQGVRAGGKKVANLSCPDSLAHLLAHEAGAFGSPDWVLLADSPNNVHLQRHLAAGGHGWTSEGTLVHWSGATGTRVIDLVAIPATVYGSAHHNIANALAAASLAHALGVDHQTIASALSAFGRDPDDNPGRLERYDLGGVHVLLDFAHNPHGVRALAPSVRHLRGSGRLIAALGQAGDRSHEDLVHLVREVVALTPDEVFVRPMPGYERGRTFEEMRAMFVAAFGLAGFPPDDLLEAESEVDFLEQALARARPGDLVLLLVHYQRTEVRQWLAQRLASV